MGQGPGAGGAMQGGGTGSTSFNSNALAALYMSTVSHYSCPHMMSRCKFLAGVILPSLMNMTANGVPHFRLGRQHDEAMGCTNRPLSLYWGISYHEESGCTKRRRYIEFVHHGAANGHQSVTRVFDINRGGRTKRSCLCFIYSLPLLLTLASFSLSILLFTV